MTGKESRLSRIIRPESGRTLIIAVDHGMALGPMKGIEDLRFHDLRHNLASHLAMAVAGTQVFQEILGHSAYRMTQR